MTLIDQPICVFCTRLRAPKAGKWGLFCDAFPDGKGIPESILTSQVDHRTQAVDGDHGLRFHAQSPAAASQAAAVIQRAHAPAADSPPTSGSGAKPMRKGLPIEPDADPWNRDWLRAPLPSLPSPEQRTVRTVRPTPNAKPVRRPLPPQPPAPITRVTITPTPAQRKRLRDMWVASFGPIPTDEPQAGKGRLVAADGIDEGAWDGAASNYASAAAYCAACLIDENEAGQPKTKGECKLPVRTASGQLNRNAVHAAAAALAGGRGGVMASPAAKKAAAKRLVSLYGQLKEEVPPSIQQMAR